MKEQEQQKQENRKDPENKGLAQLGKYSGIVIQMFVVIFLTTWGGTKLDQKTQIDTPVFTIVLSLFGVFAAIYLAIRDFIKK